MIYAHLLHIMRHIKKFVQCPGCSQSFTNRDIDLVELHDDGMLVYVDCPRCHTEIEMEIGIQDGNLIPIINVSREPAITKEDVENVAAQLEKHKGALRSLFSKSGGRKKKK